MKSTRYPDSNSSPIRFPSQGRLPQWSFNKATDRILLTVAGAVTDFHRVPEYRFRLLGYQKCHPLSSVWIDFLSVFPITERFSNTFRYKMSHILSPVPECLLQLLCHHGRHLPVLNR